MQRFFFSSVIVLSDFPASFPSAFLIFLFRLSFSCMPFFLLLLMLSCHFRHLAMIVQAPFSIGSSSALCQTLHSGFHEINRLNRRLCGFFSMTDSCPEYAVLKVTLQSFLNLWMAETGFSLNPFFQCFSFERPFLCSSCRAGLSDGSFRVFPSSSIAAWRRKTRLQKVSCADSVFSASW